MLRIIAFIALFIALPAQADTLEALLARHTAWRGGPAFVNMTTLSMSGTMETAGLKGSASLSMRRDGAARQDYELSGVKGVIVVKGAIGVNGSEVWTVTPSGQIEKPSPGMIAELQRSNAILLGTALRDRSVSRRFAGTEMRDGMTLSIVRLGFGDADVYDLLIDGRSGALMAVRATIDGEERTTEYRDWRIVRGVRVPFDTQTLQRNSAQNARFVATKADVDAPLADALFSAPKISDQLIAFTDGRTSTGWLPFDFFRENRIYLPVSVNGSEAQALLDSGAEMTVLDKAFADKLGLKAEGAVAARGTGGEAQANFAKGVTIRLGNLELKNMTVAIVDLSGVSRSLGIPLSIVLGKELFNELVLDIDFAGRRIAFADPANFTPSPGAAKLQLYPEQGIRSVELQVEGREPIRAVFDLGSGTALTLHEAYWREQNLLNDRPSSTTLAGAIGGMHAAPIATLKNVRFGGVTLHDVPVVFAKAVGASDTRRVGGNVGMPILSRFRLAIDFKHDALYLTPRADTISAPFNRNRSGLLTTYSGDHLKVTHVAENSPAAKAGWKTGEEIVAINGQPVAADYWRALYRWMSGPAGSHVTLTMRDGGRRVLVLRDYY